MHTYVIDLPTFIDCIFVANHRSHVTLSESEPSSLLSMPVASKAETGSVSVEILKNAIPVFLILHYY